MANMLAGQIIRNWKSIFVITIFEEKLYVRIVRRIYCRFDTALQTSRKMVVTVSKAFVTPVMLPGITKLRIRIQNTEFTVQRSGKRLVRRWPVVGGPTGKRSVRAAAYSGLQE